MRPPSYSPPSYGTAGKSFPGGKTKYLSRSMMAMKTDMMEPATTGRALRWSSRPGGAERDVEVEEPDLAEADDDEEEPVVAVLEENPDAGERGADHEGDGGMAAADGEIGVALDQRRDGASETSYNEGNGGDDSAESTVKAVAAIAARF